MERNVLYADPDPDARERFKTTAAAMEVDLTVTTAGTVEKALSAFEDTDFDVVIAEVAFDDADGRRVFRRSREAGVPAVAFTDRPFEALVEDGFLEDVSAYSSKKEDEPFETLASELSSLLRDVSEIPYPTSDDEEDRLAAVDRYDLAELRTVESFDRLTRIAQNHFGVDFSFIGLITEDKEEFLAYQGDDTTRTERSCTICTFGIMEDGMLEVEDTETDPRFRYIDALHDAGIKWYAGMPLVTADGHRIGMFCIAHGEEQEMSDEDDEMLRLLADEAMDRIEMHRTAAGEEG